MSLSQQVHPAVALKMARAALDMSQLELCGALDMSKATLARIETFQARLKSGDYLNAMSLFRDMGVIVSLEEDGSTCMRVAPKAYQLALLKARVGGRTDRKRMGLPQWLEELT